MQVRELINKLLDYPLDSFVLAADDIVFQDDLEREGLKENEVPVGFLYDIENVDSIAPSVIFKFTNRAAKKLLTYEAKAKAYDQIKKNYKSMLGIIANGTEREMIEFAEAWFEDLLKEGEEKEEKRGGKKNERVCKNT